MPFQNAHTIVQDEPAISVTDESGRDELSLLDFLTVLAEKKRLILQVTLGTVVLAIVVSLLLPSWYTAKVTLLPPQQNSSLGAALSSQLGSLGGMAALAGGGALGLKNPNEMYIAMLKSRTVEDAMIQRYRLMDEYGKRYPSDARKAFEKHSSADVVGKDGLIHITVEDRDPVRAAELANGYVAQFRNLSEHLAITEAGQRRLFFEHQLEDAKNNLATAEEALKETQQKTGLIQLDSQARALIQSAATLRAQIAAKEVQIHAIKTYATGENAQVVQAQSELQGLQTQLARLSGTSEGGDELIVPKGKVPESGLQYVRKVRDVKYYETIFEILARQFEMAKLDEARQGAVIQVVDTAVPPDKRSFPRRTVIVLAAMLLGLLMGTLWALFQTAYRNFVVRGVTDKKWSRFVRAVSSKPSAK